MAQKTMGTGVEEATMQKEAYLPNILGFCQVSLWLLQVLFCLGLVLFD